MKQFILTIALTLSALSAFAHPKDSDSVMNLPVRTKVVVTNDINLLPGTVMYWLKQGDSKKTAADNEYIQNGGVVCSLSFNQISDDDRVIRAGTEYEMTTPVDVKVHGFGSSYASTTATFSINSRTIPWVQCTVRGDFDTFTIGRLRAALKANFSVEIAKPIPVR